MTPKQAEDVPIAQALRLLREREGVSQTEVARRGGPDFRTISHWETGLEHPSLRLLIRFLNVLNLDLHDLQRAFDRITERPDRLTGRIIEVERRLNILERWRLEMAATSMTLANEGKEPCEPSTETLTES